MFLSWFVVLRDQSVTGLMVGMMVVVMVRMVVVQWWWWWCDAVRCGGDSGTVVERVAAVV
ncbi:hypothetical protein HanXRQr2_Chr02g0053721 [Helianthus annuus]|uniref:Transmembrane protein n=1 Tax=Helianthus annuus TaxID=4232 RepID=A0A9K3JLY8_HELAN|nr:hypothetical protein HanXRQr2_Chr02g0053721 [Helianthus annuus]KAJ0950833.1 hypothetical protein HanPSC8_Chr02g0052811 [Helianthus annuus]